MQSVALQSSATPCGSHGYRHEEALALRARLRGFAATLGDASLHLGDSYQDSIYNVTLP